ncbi:pentapeptide repeat-containing protein [Streptomyces sp. NPDC056479]|uniref:pentapeptide repeat-containing protein n=1 Tax=Streptomyces sp. NPDC056479 TaxID=3345832 RepID=UPI00368A18F8
MNLTGANLIRAGLTGANLTGADLTGARPSDADLTLARLTGARMTGMGLTGADLTDARHLKLMSGIMWDRGTRWPGNLGSVAWALSDEVHPGTYLVRGESSRPHPHLSLTLSGQAASAGRGQEEAVVTVLEPRQPLAVAISGTRQIFRVQLKACV